MEYCSKGSLFNFLKDPQNEINWEIGIRIAVQMTKGLETLHTWYLIKENIKILN